MVSVKIPNYAADALRNLPVIGERYLFTTGKASSRTAAGVWDRKFGRVWEKAAAIMGREFEHTPTPHRFRHTFAIELLQQGVDAQDVADLMGHSDRKVVLRHYRKWVPGLQDRLDNIVERARAQHRKSKLVKLPA
jgi:integrase